MRVPNASAAVAISSSLARQGDQSSASAIGALYLIVTGQVSL